MRDSIDHKSGELWPEHHLLAKSRLIAAARTAQPTYVLIDSGHGFPYAVADARARQEDRRVALLGEIYEVDDATRAQIEENAKTYFAQASLVLDPAKTEIRYNSEWCDQLGARGMIELSSTRSPSIPCTRS